MAQAAPAASTLAVHSVDMDRLMGFILVAVLPALFWTTVVTVVCASFGVAFSLFAAAGLGLAIMGFLGLIYSVLSYSAPHKA